MLQLALRFLVPLVMIFLILPAHTVLATASTPTLSLSPQSASVNTSCQFSVNINIDTAGQASDGSDAILFYDPTRLQVVSISQGTAFPTSPNNIFDNQKGQLTVNGLISPGQPFNGAGLLAKVNFKVVDGAPLGLTQVTFDFDPNNKTKTSDSNIVKSGQAVDILDNVINGSYTIVTGSCNISDQPPIGGSNISVSPQPTLPQSGNQKTTELLTAFASAMAFLGLLGAIFFTHH